MTAQSCRAARRNHERESRLRISKFRQLVGAEWVHGTMRASVDLVNLMPIPTPMLSSSQWHPGTKAYLVREIPERGKKFHENNCFAKKE